MVGSLTVLSLSMHAKVPGDVPVETVRVARGGFPEGSLAIRVRDESANPW